MENRTETVYRTKEAAERAARERRVGLVESLLDHSDATTHREWAEEIVDALDKGHR